MNQRNRNQQQYVENNRNNYNMRNQPYRNNNNQINKVGEIQNGQFFVDEFGQKFLQKIDNQMNIRKRIFLHKNDSGRALHEMKVKYSLVETQNQQSTNLKAVIESVEDTYSEIKPLIGFFSNTPNRPSIDFDLQSRQLGYANLKKVYFFPLQINYPTMVLELDQSSQTCQSGDIFKYYYIVKVIDWPERLSREGPLVEIIDQKGMLYDQESDCQALLESLNMNSTISSEEKKYVDKIVKNHQNAFQNNNNSKEFKNINAFTIDQQGTQAFDDAFSFQKISTKILEQEIQLAKQPKKIQKTQNQPIQEKGKNAKGKNGKQGKQKEIYVVKQADNQEPNQNESGTKQEQQEPNQSIEEQKEVDQTVKQQQIQEPEEQKQSEPEQEDTECSRKIFKLGIHIADLSQSIQKDTPLYKALEKRGQSIYVPLGKNKSFVKHMLDRKLVQIFSLKAGEKKQAKSLFICIEKDQNNQFIFHWDSLRLENSIIESKQNYYYEEFDSYLKDKKQSINELFKDDDDEEVSSDSDEEDDGIQTHEAESNPKNKSLILTNEEFLTFFNLGGQLFQQRIQKGQKAFQEEFTEKCKFLSSKLVEELMVFYNQSISRQIQVSQQIFKGQKDIEKKLEVLQKEAKQMKKSIETDQTQISNKIKKQQKVLATSKKSIDTLRKNIKLTEQKIKNNPKTLKEYENKISTNQKKIEELKNQIEQISIMEESQFEQEFNKNKKKGAQKKAEIQQQNCYEELEKEQLSDSSQNQILLSQGQLGDNLRSEKLVDQNILQGEEDIQPFSSSDKSDDSDEESDTESKDTLQNNNEMQNDSGNIYTALKKRLNQQLQNLNKQLEQLDKELNNLDQQKISNKNEEAKKSIKDTLNYYKNKCEQVGFNNLKYDSLLEFQSSIDKLKYAKITPIIKTYLLFEKRKIVRQLNQYFAICDDEKKEQEQLHQKIQQKKDQKSKISKDIKAIQDRIIQAEKSEEEQKFKDSELQHQEQINVEEEIFSEDDQTETRSQISIEDLEKSFTHDNDNIKIASLKQRKINQLQQQIKQKENEILKIQKQISSNDSKIQELNSSLEKYQKQSEKLEEQIKTQDIQINDLKKQLDELKSEILKIDQNIKDEQKNLLKQLEKDVNENYKYFDLSPESEKYLSLTSPIRKFNDIQAQQFIDDYLKTDFSKEFDVEYSKIIKSKQTTNKIKNQVAKFLEKAQKIKNCRKMIRQAQQGKKQDEKQEILQINSKIISKFIIYDFFLPKQMQIVQLKNDKNRPQLQEVFSIWNGEIQAKYSLPYDYTVANAIKNNIKLTNLDF
ncbi:RNB-like protein (macronuclear) [Tetrahymena thermophila SB210]|uniref:RNB-like protein n=1 Tax=Tetrahymena thermophila (strain SB210) TaxID=312017 RepID=I7M127_TETTS|nr:RNB-like protein [Tetrahymena thermophila SB210]EAR94124.1 RNB-like protein [Tetrahymena thermophila SB210]|eukprot:XP_001014369.1 RNB-like protein [Tetrahymena thermophila SB210]